MEQTLLTALQHIRDRDEAVALAADPRNLNIVAEGSIITYTEPRSRNEQQFNGILPVLGIVFWPDDVRKTRTFLRNKAKDAARRQAQSRMHTLAKAVREDRTHLPNRIHVETKKRMHHMMAGMAYGSLMHRQLEDSIYLDMASFERKYGAMATSTKAILTYIHGDGVTLVRPEFAVYDAELALCARFDAWGVRKDGTIILYEYKSGSKHCFRAEGPSMTGPLYGIMGDSDKNRALIQLAFSVLILLKHHPYVTRYEAYVLRATGDEDGTGKNTIKSYPLSSKFLAQYGPQIYAAVRASRVEGSK
jgi:hypothetical protein